MKRKLLSIGILGITLVALVACGSNEKSDQTTEKITSESTTLDNTSEQETTTGETEDETTEKVTSGQITNEPTTQEPTTQEKTTQQTTTVAKPTETTTTKKTDKNADYKEMEDYAKSFGCDYTYIKSFAEYKQYAEAHEGQKYAVIYKNGMFDWKEDKLYELSTYDAVEEIEHEFNATYECRVMDWKLSNYISEMKEEYGLVKTYFLKDEKDIDMAIADIKKTESMGKQVFVGFVYRDDIVKLQSKISSKIESTDFDDSSYMLAPYSGTGTGSTGYYFWTEIYCANWQPNPTVPEGITVGASDYKKAVRYIYSVYPDLEFKYVTTDEEFVEYAESHVGQQFAVIFPKGTIRKEIGEGELLGYAWPELSIEERFTNIAMYDGEYFTCVVMEWL